MSEPLPPPLEYATARGDQLRPARMVFQAVLSCTFTCGLLVGSVFFGLLFAYANNASTTYLIVAVTCGVLLLGGFIALAIRFHGQPLRRGLALGIWIGIGLACLFEGLCFSGALFR